MQPHATVIYRQAIFSIFIETVCDITNFISVNVCNLVQYDFREYFENQYSQNSYMQKKSLQMNRQAMLRSLV